MRHAAQKRPTTGIIVLLCILCVGSLFGLAYGKPRGGPVLLEKAADAVVENTSASNTYTIYSAQPHLLTPPIVGHGPNGKGGGKTPTSPGATPTPPQGGSTPTATSTAPQGSPTPPPNNGTTLPPGSALPSESACAGRVSYSSFEPRPDNYSANHSVPTSAQIAGLQPWTPAIGMSSNSDSLRKQITGNFTGTTDEIFQWAAAKWGLPDDLLRTIAYMESDWRQSNHGDYVDDRALCPPGYRDSLPCPVTFGITGTKSISWPGIFPWNRDSTAAAVEVLGGWLRGCYEGWVWWLGDHGNRARGVYHAGDIWGCVGAWYSGNWLDGSATAPQTGEHYIALAQRWMQRRPWLRPGF
jgi:hypothetical protein